MINNANLKFDENGVPYSSDFDDIYFSKKDGIAETTYVFLKHNGIPSRFKNTGCFHIAETGFGTGLNLLVTWQQLNLANQSNPSPVKLKFTTFEKYPLSKSDLTSTLSAWPKFKSLSVQLLNAYPEKLLDDNTMILENGNVELRLIIGDVNESITNLDVSNNEVDAWYLDGFAPSKNPDMWTENLFNNMRRLTKEQGTIATFTAAGHVRRGLIKAGFDVIKYKGFGYKRDMVASRGILDRFESDSGK
ncbi:hypothetical protein GCM10009128_05820 [Psychrosphaera haliotis]|uniref:tRNA (5-methylaminomethyl-2-thiouridine)(34)-methyltransferase MnmD n=1 Tax=Psychrosphaera haliotis TaxID=555083 RepID=UPI0031D1F3BF